MPYLNDNLYLVMAMSGVYEVLRIAGAVGLLRDRMRALLISLLACEATLVLMIFLLPAGLLDGVLTGAALVLILAAWIASDREVVSAAGIHPGRIAAR